LPSIEIVCIGQRRPTRFSALPFAVESSTKLLSHRGKSLFHADFEELRGCMYHLGNPRLRGRSNDFRFYFASDLLSRACRDAEPVRFLEFTPRFREALDRMLRRLVTASPVGRLLFTTDWQFGPRRATRGGELTLTEFWRRHARRRLRLNGGYTIVAADPSRPGRRASQVCRK